MTTFRSASASDAGRVRTVNQDVALATERLVAVADGMGGHAAGDVAARMTISSIEGSVRPTDGPDTLIDAALTANRAVFDEAEAHPEMRGMGTTLTAAAIVRSGDTERICLINVGDSRAYLLEGGQLARLTDDHSLVEQLVRQGELTAEEATVHPHRHILTRALGIDPELEIDSWLLEPRPGMRLLLCTDGLTNECTEEEIAVVLRDQARPIDAARNLVERAIAHGGNDNITAVVVDIDTDAIAADPDVSSSAVDDAEDDDLADHPIPVTVAEAIRRSPAPSGVRARGAPQTSEGGRDRIVTGRVVLFIIVLLGILGGVAGFTVWFDRATYFVGIDNGNVAIFEGRPSGMLWFHPTLVTRSSTPISAVLEANLPLLRAGILESSYDAAAQTASNLASEKSLLGLGIPHPTTTTTTTPTTTTSGKNSAVHPSSTTTTTARAHP